MTVFDVFDEVPFTYLEISRGEVYGNRIVSEKQLTGVFKLRSGMTASGNQETRDSNSTLHVHPEDFQTIENIVGNGVRHAGNDYSIIGYTDGRNFNTGATEHYTLTLEDAEFTEESVQ